MDIPWLLEQLKSRWEVITKDPIAFFLLAAVGVVIGYASASWYFSRRLTDRDDLITSKNETIATKDGQLGRYRVALGIDKPSQGNLIELTNEEMRAKALSTVAAMREFTISLRRQTDSATVNVKEESERARKAFQVMKEMSDEFDRTLKADSNLVDNELRRRLGRQAVAAIVGVPPSIISASDNTARRGYISGLCWHIGGWH